MRERQASHRQNNTSLAQGPVLNPGRHTFPRILTTATMALVLGVLLPGCHGARPRPAAGAQPAQTAPAQSYPAQSPAQSSAPPQQQDAQYSPPPQQQYPPDQQQQDDQSGGDAGVYDTQNPYDDQTYQQDAYNDGYQQGYEQGIQANTPPPELPVYEQPSCPGPGYIWNPGYWSWGEYGYYWVPGVWVLAPYTGALWTPPWWGFFGGLYRWHSGYWGSHVGFYRGGPHRYGYTRSGYH